MPESRRYPLTELPPTLQRSSREAQETFLRALDDAMRAYGEGDQAQRTACSVLKQGFEERGGHWIAKRVTAESDGDGEAGQLAAM